MDASLDAEVARLEAKVDELTGETTYLELQRDELRAENDRLRVENERLKSQIRDWRANPRKTPGRKPYGHDWYERRVLDAMRELWLANLTGQEIADELNRKGFHYRRRCRTPWTRQAVYNVVSRHKRLWLVFDLGDDPRRRHAAPGRGRRTSGDGA